MKNSIRFVMRSCMFSLTASIVTSALAYAVDYSTIPFEQRKQMAKQVAKGLKVDGDDRDWGTFPARFGSYFNGAGDQSRALLSTRVLADEGGLHVCLRTKGIPSNEDFAFGFKLDFADTEAMDVEFSETAGGQCPSLKYVAPGHEPSNRAIEGVQAAVGRCVEWYVPWESLAQALPEAREQIVGKKVRPWVRVMPYSQNRQNNVVTDYGAAVACVRLPAKPEELDPPLADSEKRAELPLMVEGQSYVICGANEGKNGSADHRFKYCYDLSSMTVQHFPARVRDAHDNVQYPIFGRKIISPIAGQIKAFRDSAVDHPALVNSAGALSNFVALQAGENILWFIHNKHGSMVPKAGDWVVSGDPIAQIGDTGPAGWPHVHFQVQRGNVQGENLIPVVLKNVRVSLNGGGGDFWARDLENWNIQEGYFVETKEPSKK